VAEPGSTLLGHDELLRGLWRAAREGRLPHALLFEGPAGIGKFGAALLLVRGLLCQRASPAGPCGTCPGCKKVLSGNHLDLFVLDVAHEDVPESKRQERIRIDRVVRRSTPDAWDGPVIEEFLGLRAAEGGWRAVVVREAERLSHSQNEAQNALLKMLEEPGERVLWVLETAQPQALLPTVRSRCVSVRLQPLAEPAALAVLAAHGLEGQPARQLARWARGSPGEALALRERCAVAFRALLADVLTGRRDPLDAARGVWEQEGTFQGRTPSARQRDQARALLDLSLDVVGDLLRHACGQPAATLGHGDLAEPLEPPPHELVLRRALATLLALRADLERNLDAQVLVDEALLTLATLTRTQEVTT
jgi:DNA polymerase-3 subunit delta'